MECCIPKHQDVWASYNPAAVDSAQEDLIHTFMVPQQNERYPKVSNISRTKLQNLNASLLIL